jgi:Spy/CpxP family protein refolding chaperone
MKLIRFRLLIATAAVLLGTALAQSQTATDAPAPKPIHAHGEWGMGRGHMEFFAKSLNLTDDQKAQMKTIMQKEHASMKPLEQQMRQTHEALRQYEQGTFDEAKVRALAAQQAQAHIEMTVAQTRIHNQMFQLLTPEQQTQLKTMQARHEARMQERMQQHANQAPPAAPEQQ